ncbi:MAG: tetratricopeptide repeat protein [Myxococcota bacterium]
MRSDDHEQLIKGLPETRQELLSAARALDIEGRSRAAVELLESAVRQAPSQALRKALAILYQRVDRPADCAAVLDDVVRREPGDIPSLMLLAEAYVEAGDHARANSVLTKAETLGASRTGITQLRRKLERAANTAKPTSPTNSSGGPPPMPPPLPGDKAGGDEQPSPPPHDPATEEMPSPRLDNSPTDSGLESVESSIFEDGTFSNLSSQSLAEGAAALDENEESSVFDTLVNHDYEEDDPDRSFDALLSDLGVPVEESPTIEEGDATIDRTADASLLEEAEAGAGFDDALPDEKTAAVDLDQIEGRSLTEDSHASADLAGEPFEDAPTEVSKGAPDETTDPIASPNPLTRDAAAGDDIDAPMDEAPTDMSAPLPRDASPGLSQDSAAEDMPADEFPDELPTQIEPEQKKKRRRATQRNKAISREDLRTSNEIPSARRPQSSGARPATSGDGSPAKPASGRQQNQQRRASGQRGAAGPSQGQPSRQEQNAARLPGPSGRSSSPFDQGEVPAPSGGSRKKRSRGGSPLDNVRELAGGAWTKVSSGMPNSTLLVAIPVVVVILLGTLLGVGAWAMSSLGDRIEDGLREARRQQRVDTYRGYLGAEQTLSNTANATSFAGSAFDNFVEGIGMTSSRVESKRASAAVELALVTSMVEFRYEELDARNSLAHIETADDLAGPDPRLTAARTYRFMTEGFSGKARDTLSAAMQEYPRSRAITAARIELELHDGSADAAHEAATLFRDTEQYDVYPKFLLGRVALARGEDSAVDVFRRILRDSSPKHLSARIEQSYAIRLDDDDQQLDKARDLVSPVLGNFSKRASPLQTARAHIALGDTYLGEDLQKEARVQFEKARQTSPTRAAVHLPLIDFYLDTGRTEEALAATEQAIEQAGKSDALALRQAQVLHQSGEFEEALQALEDVDTERESTALLAGYCHLDLGDHESAQTSFEQAAKLAEDEATEARAFALLSRAGPAEELDEDWLEQMNEFVETSDDAPVVLRASGLLRLEFAEAESGYREQRDLFEGAVDVLSSAAEKREDWYLIEYDLCRAQMRSGRGSQAFAHCKRGRKLNARYRPGIATAIQLAILRGRYDDASSIAADLIEAFPDAADVSFAQVRAAVAQRELQSAETQINRWAGKSAADSHDAKMAEGLLAFRKNDYRSALGYFQRAHEAAPRDVEAAVYYAWTAARLGDDDGEDILGDRLSDPLWGPRAWQALGELRKSQGKLRDARENFSKALDAYRKSIAPEWRESESYAELARTWAEERGWDHTLTRRFVSRASSRGDEESVPAHMVNGEYDLKKRRRELDKAADHFERVLARESYNCEAIDYLLDIYDDRGLDDDLERIEELEDEHCK